MSFAYILPRFLTSRFLNTVFCEAGVFNCSEVQFYRFFSCSHCLMLHLKSHPGLPWWLRGKESACSCRSHGFDAWSGRIPLASARLSPWATTVSLCSVARDPQLLPRGACWSLSTLEPVLHDRRSRCSDGPRGATREQPPFAETREKLVKQQRASMAKK